MGWGGYNKFLVSALGTFVLIKVGADIGAELENFLAPTLEEPYISECLSLSISICLSVCQNCSILTSNLIISATDNLIELNLAILINLSL